MKMILISELGLKVGQKFMIADDGLKKSIFCNGKSM